jgi:serine/threonine protein kinase, bacterial
MITLFSDIFEKPIKNGFILSERYQLNCFIGKGSYGLAYHATDLKTNKKVVVKQLRNRKRKARNGFLEREARMLKTLHHPAIPRWIDLFEENEKSFLVMELVKGKNVEELIFYDNQKFNEKASFQILLDVLKVVKYIHEKGIIHRDLRLPNILFKGNEIFIIDFGLAVFCNETDPNPYESMPLEKRLFREIAFASDFYALGHFVLFLLYSDYQSSSFKNKSWEEELQIGIESKQIIRKLLKLETSYENANDIILDIEKMLLNM